MWLVEASDVYLMVLQTATWMQSGTILTSNWRSHRKCASQLHFITNIVQQRLVAVRPQTSSKEPRTQGKRESSQRRTEMAQNLKRMNDPHRRASGQSIARLMYILAIIINT